MFSLTTGGVVLLKFPSEQKKLRSEFATGEVPFPRIFDIFHVWYYGERVGGGERRSISISRWL